MTQVFKDFTQYHLELKLIKTINNGRLSILKHLLPIKTICIENKQ